MTILTKYKFTSWFKSLFCRHHWVFHRTVYGDEINHAKGKRVVEVCTKCERLRYVNKSLPGGK